MSDGPGVGGAPCRSGPSDETLRTLYSVGCRITAGDHQRVEQLIVATIADAHGDDVTIGPLILDLARRAATDHDSRRRAIVELLSERRLPAAEAAASLGVVRDDIESVLAASSPDMLRPFDRWMDDETMQRCRQRTTGRPDPRTEPGHRQVHAGLFRRWALAAGVAAVAVGAVAATGVIFDNDRPAQPETDAPSLAINPAGYVIDNLPAGFRPAGAFVRSAPDTGGWLQVWAAPEAARTTGDWLAIATIGTDVSGRFVLPGGRSIMVAGQPAVEATTPDGVDQLSVELSEGGRVSLAGHGMPAADLHEIAAGIVVNSGRFGFGAASALLDGGLDLLASQPSAYGTTVSAAPVGASWTSTYQTEDLSRRILLTVRPSTTNDLEVTRFILTGEAMSEDSRTIEVAERRVVVSAAAGIDGTMTHTLQWHDGQDTITLSGTADLDQLIDMVDVVRRAGTAEWHLLEELPPSYYPL